MTDCGESGCRRFPCSFVDGCELHENLCNVRAWVWGLEEILLVSYFLYSSCDLDKV